MKKLTVILLAGSAAFAMSSVARAADLMVSEPPPMAPAMSAPAGGAFDGPYVGIIGGFAAGNADHKPGPGFPGPSSGNDLDLSGALLGVDIGANFYLSDKVVGGIAGDLAWSDVSGKHDFGGGFGEITHTINWEGSVRGVLGLDAGAIMPYLTAGVAFANADRKDPDLSNDDPSATHVGWTAGLGVAIAATDNMTVDLSYRHSDYGDATYHYNDINRDVKVGLTQDAVMVGLNWHM